MVGSPPQPTCPLRGAATVVSIDSVHTNPSILTPVVRAVVNIPLAGAAFKTWKAVAFKSEVASLTAGASIDTRRGCTGYIRAVTVLACEALGALASVGTRKVETGATMLAASWHVTLIDICVTLVPCEACRTSAGELVGHRCAGAPICTGMRQTGICPLAQLPCKADLAGALVGVPAEHVAGTPILTEAGHKAGVRGRVLAVLPCEPWSTPAGGFPQHGLRHTSTPILTTVFLTGVSMLTIFSQEALWTFAVACAIVVSNAGPFIYTGLLTTSTLQSVRGARAAQPEPQQRPQRGGTQSGHLRGRRQRRSAWEAGSNQEPRSLALSRALPCPRGSPSPRSPAAPPLQSAQPGRRPKFG